MHIRDATFSVANCGSWYDTGWSWNFSSTLCSFLTATTATAVETTVAMQTATGATNMRLVLFDVQPTQGASDTTVWKCDANGFSTKSCYKRIQIVFNSRQVIHSNLAKDLSYLLKSKALSKVLIFDGGFFVIGYR